MATLTGFVKDNEGSFIDKDPGAKLNYTIDWTDWMPTSGTITTSTWALQTITGDAAPLVNHATSIDTYKTSVTISGGTAGKIYKVTNTITLGTGLIDKRYFRLNVKARTL
jgi:hypothetical protein